MLYLSLIGFFYMVYKYDIHDIQVVATDTWGQLVLLTTNLNHKTCINTSRQVLERTLFAINAIFKESIDSK